MMRVRVEVERSIRNVMENKNDSMSRFVLTEDLTVLKYTQVEAFPSRGN